MTTGLHPPPPKLRVNITFFFTPSVTAIFCFKLDCSGTSNPPGVNTCLCPECSSPTSDLPSLTSHSDTVIVTLGSLLLQVRRGDKLTGRRGVTQRRARRGEVKDWCLVCRSCAGGSRVTVGLRGQGQETLADLTGAFSCGVPGGRSGRSSARSGGT